MATLPTDGLDRIARELASIKKHTKTISLYVLLCAILSAIASAVVLFRSLA